MIERMLDRDERVLWKGAPQRNAYIFSFSPLFFFGLIWGIIDISILFGASSVFKSAEVGVSAGFFAVPFFMLHMTPFWLAVFGPFYRLFNHRYIDYVITDRRVYIQSGIVGRDISTYEYTDIANVSVNVGITEKLFNCGSVLISSGATVNSNGKASTGIVRLKAVSEPYDVYKLLKELSLDVKADIYYPNAIRPESNPGYRTRLDTPEAKNNSDNNGFAP